MKRKLENCSFSKAEIIIFREVADENHSFPLLGKKPHIKPNLLPHHLRKLSQNGFVVFRKSGESPSLQTEQKEQNKKACSRDV